MNEQASVPRIKRQDAYIVAMLEHPTLQKAASAVGVSDITLWRCMKKPEFADAYRKARREAFSQSVARLQHASNAAVGTLLRVMTGGIPPLEAYPANQRARMETLLNELKLRSADGTQPMASKA